MQGYPASKTLAEKAAWKFAEENHIDLITVIPSLITGPSLTPDIPSSVGLATSLITGSTIKTAKLTCLRTSLSSFNFQMLLRTIPNDS